MKRLFAVIVLLQLGILSQATAAKDVDRSETIKKTLRFKAGSRDRLVVVDNVFGSIEVRGHEGEDVQVVVRKTIEARSEEKIEEAEEEVTLDITEEDEKVELFVDGPFRNRRRGGIDWRGYRHEGYKVTFDFVIEVPKGCALRIKTVNDGDIQVQSVDGDFEVHNVNGSIEMEGVRGSGVVYTVNGEVRVEFESNPRADCSVGTINGDVRLYFQPDLSADFYMKTMNGDLFTDFEVEALPGKTKTSKTRNGKKVYQVARMSGVRAGKGGPEIELNTLNGDMFILSK